MTRVLAWLRRYLERDDRLTSAQLVARCYADAGIDLFPAGAHHVVPADFTRLHPPA